MIERPGFTLHVDSPGERTARARFRINGWIVADEQVERVWVQSNRERSLEFYDRPDVVRVFPTRRFARGFSGNGTREDLGSDGLVFRVRIGGREIELEHPLPPGAPELPLGRRFAAGLTLAVLGFRARLASNPTDRWNLVLRRHLFRRELRSNIFRREHCDALLADFAEALPNAVFVQIGANDGLTGDPLHGILSRRGLNWRGVMVEPIRHLFIQLQERYGSRAGLRLESAAIGEVDGTVAIYRVRTESGDPLWLEQLASLDRDVLARNAGQMGQSADRIISESVPSLTVTTLLARNQVETLDLLIIDTEGWDWRILRQFDFRQLKPALILYEHQHLSAGDRDEAHAFLRRYSYEWAEMPEGDTLGWRRNLVS